MNRSIDQKPRVAVDCDGVLGDCVGAVCRGLTSTGCKRTPEEIKHHRFALSLSKEETDIALSTMGKPEFARHMPWYPDAKAFLSELQKVADVTILTSPFAASATWMEDRKQWFRGKVEPRDIVYCSGQHKARFQADYLIEDHPGTAADWCDKNPKGLAFLVDRPWNQPGAAEYRDHARMVRCLDLPLALTFINLHVAMRASA